MGTSFNITVFGSFAEIAGQWENFESYAHNYAFQNFDWLSCWYETIGHQTITPCITLVEYPAHEPLMLLPLGLEKRNGLLCLTWLGGKLSDYHGPLLSPDCAKHLSPALFAQLWQQLKQQLPSFDAVCFEKMPETIGGQANPFLNLPCIANASSGHFTELGGHYENFLKQHISNNAIKDHRRNLRRLEDHGPVEFVIATKPEQIQDLLATMMTQKARSYQELGVANLFAQPGITDFCQTISKDTAGFFVHLSALTSGDAILATHWGLVYKKRFYYMYPSYERNALVKYSPGTVLLWKLFEWCINNGVETYDFTIGDEPYKDKWCKSQLDLFDCYQGISAKGHLLLWPLTQAKRLKRFIKHNPVLWKMTQALRAKLGTLGK